MFQLTTQRQIFCRSRLLQFTLAPCERRKALMILLREQKPPCRQHIPMRQEPRFKKLLCENCFFCAVHVQPIRMAHQFKGLLRSMPRPLFEYRTNALQRKLPVTDDKSRTSSLCDSSIFCEITISAMSVQTRTGNTHAFNCFFPPQPRVLGSERALCACVPVQSNRWVSSPSKLTQGSPFSEARELEFLHCMQPVCAT